MKEKQHSNRVLVSTGIPKFALEQLEKLKSEHDNKNAILKLNDVDKIYENGFQAIFGTSISLHKGEFLALLGPSGCGKTTTLRMIAGLESVTSGKVLINNIDSTLAEPSQRNITMVFQNYALFPHLSVKNNIAFGLKANKKKLGEGGKIYKQQKFISNEIEADKTLIKNIENVDKFEAKIEAYNKKLSVLKNNIAKVEKEDQSKPRVEKKLEVLHINKLSLENQIEKAQQDAKAFRADIKNLDKIKNRISKNVEKHTTLEEKRKALASEDNYSEIINKKVQDAANILGLEYYLDRKPSALSGGQRQRVALGRSIVGSPTLFLMDEPLSNLDAKLRASMRRQIRELHEKINTATVYVTHDQVEAMTMADKIAVMSDGFVMQIGSPKDVYKNPSCKFVGSFVGLPSMNIFDGVIKKGVFTSDSGFKVKLPKYKLKNVEEGQRVNFGIRPTDFSGVEDVKDAYKSSLKVTIISKELLGNEIQYTGIIDGTKSEVTFLTSSYDDRKIGEKTSIHLISSRIHLFDDKTTIALTSEFNYETLESLKNWSVSNDKIAIRRKIMEAAKKKSEKQGIIKKLVNKNKKKDTKNK